MAAQYLMTLAGLTKDHAVGIHYKGGGCRAREAGFPDMEKIVGWTALMGPPGLAKEVVDKWVDVFARLAKDPAWQSGNAKLGGIAAIRSREETEKFVHEQYELYDRLVTSLGIRQ